MATQTDEPSDTVSWVSHANRILGQPQKNTKCVIPNDGLTQNEYSNKTSSQTSTGHHKTEDVGINNGSHVFKDEKRVTEEGVKSKKDTCSKKEKTCENVLQESNGSEHKSNRDQNNSVNETDSNNDAMMKSLDFIQNVVIKLKNKDEVFCNTIMKILDIDQMQDSEVKALKLNVLNIAFLLLDSTEDYLKFIEETLQAMVTDPMKRFIVGNNCIKQYSIIGKSLTSVVRTALLTKDGLCTAVALKKPCSAFHDTMIISEATILSQLDHKNIIKMLAFIKNGPGIALEFMGLGNLYQALTKEQFSDRERLTALIDIATGMEFLHRKKYLHRDLACRNVFVSVRKECKIGDFGLSVYVGDRNGVYRDTESEFRVNNGSPETIASRMFTFQTDVWSMGMLILELYQLGSSDVANKLIFHSMGVLASLIREGVPLKKPERCRRCPDDLFKFTTNCLLNRNFKNRPDFTVIRKTMENYLKK